ncbi:spore germination protein [Caldibacillus lycopersici]|uniref:Spore germination protein n=1 Tax=Perspicuibacillus lycopersici TaxID=1325689 RepID=A0AAE3IS14_9BACI|nr:spore germination protein [Perspicuibacillus lycopersici]MCU9612394.1 spore germination protein [Perspicuibacillus lycopersici]
MSVNIPVTNKISPFLVFYLIHTMQVGVGMLGFQRIIATYAGTDGWISVLLTGVILHILMWMMYKMLAIVDGDIVTVHNYIIGKKATKIVCIPIILYFCLFAISVLRTYIEIIQVWMFQELETFWFALIYLLLVIYIIYGGFRTIVGIAFFSIVLPIYILVLFLFTVPFADFSNLLPIFDHSIGDILKGSRNMTFTVLGFESILLFYPFIKNPKKSHKYAHLAILFTTIVYLYICILTFSYFSENQLQKNTWPTLTMWKIIRLPFVERFEYIGIASWFLLILPIIAISIWGTSRIIKQVYSIRQRRSVLVISLLCLIGICIPTTRSEINMVTDLTAKIGFYFCYIYVPILFVATLIKKKVKKS